MREPVLQDNRSEHLKFCRYAMQLIEMVTGKPLATGVESSIAKINKVSVVITFNNFSLNIKYEIKHWF